MTDTSPHSPQPSPTPQPEPFQPDFTPVPRKQKTHDGWTPDRQRGFIEALAELGSVAAAARRVGKTPDTAYALRRHPDAEEFRKAWETALKHGIRHLEDIAMERALYGVEVPVYHFGQIVGTRRVYNDSLLMFLLRNRAPKRFSADSYANADAATKGQIDRLKKTWRKEWEEERAAESRKSSEDICESINRKLGKMRERRLADMSPETRALHDAYEASNHADEERREAAHAARYAPRPTPALAAPPPPGDDPAPEPGPTIRSL